MNNDINIPEKQVYMTTEQKVELNKFALDLYLKGFKPKNAIPLVIKTSPTPITYITAQSLYYNVRQEYLKAMPMLNNQEATKEAVIELDELEDEIRDNVETNNSAKYSVILETKKHKHNLLGINKNTGQIEINIGTTDDDIFIKTMNEEIKVEVKSDAAS